MLVNGLRLCIGCMHRLNDKGECTYCKLQQDRYIPSPRWLIPGTVLADRYILGKVIGEGGTGITYIAWDKIQEIIVAIKEYCPYEIVIRDTIRGTDAGIYVYPESLKEEYLEHMQKFHEEAEVLSRFCHVEGIVSVRDFFYENNTAYIVMEYLEGINLKDYIEKHGGISGKRILEMMRPVVKALAKIHKTGIIHRDICPDNFVVNEDKLTLIDFGTARLNNLIISRSITIMFKRGFSPEEQYRKRGKQGAWTDIYTLCATMYYAMKNKVPEEAVERLFDDKISVCDFDETDLTDDEKNTILRGLSVKAENRYPNIELFYEDLYGETI